MTEIMLYSSVATYQVAHSFDFPINDDIRCGQLTKVVFTRLHCEVILFTFVINVSLVFFEAICISHSFVKFSIYPFIYNNMNSWLPIYSMVYNLLLLLFYLDA